MTEKKTLAIIGAIGAGASAGATVLTGANAFATEINQAFAVVAFVCSAVGTVLTAGLMYYRSNSGGSV